MPKDTIDRAIKRGQGGDADSYDEVRYEGYAPGGVAVIVEALTDNRNRTVSSVRSSFSKYGGALGETNSVSFQFNRVGQIRYPRGGGHGGRDAGSGDRGRRRGLREFRGRTRDRLRRRTSWQRSRSSSRRGSARPTRRKLTWKPQVTVPVEDDKAETLFKLLEALDENDDVQRVDRQFRGVGARSREARRLTGDDA